MFQKSYDGSRVKVVTGENNNNERNHFSIFLIMPTGEILFFCNSFGLNLENTYLPFLFLCSFGLLQFNFPIFFIKKIIKNKSKNDNNSWQR